MPTNTRREDRQRKRRYAPTVTNPGLPRIMRELAIKAQSQKGRNQNDPATKPRTTRS